MVRACDACYSLVHTFMKAQKRAYSRKVSAFTHCHGHGMLLLSLSSHVLKCLVVKCLLQPMCKRHVQPHMVSYTMPAMVQHP